MNKTTTLIAGSLGLLGLTAQVLPAEAANSEATAVDTPTAVEQQIAETVTVEPGAAPPSVVDQPIELADATTSVADLMAETQQDSLDQVTSVSQLSDVFPTDWAFQAVQSLVERYGCIAGYPDSTFRGNNKATRYELAAALNACLDQISDRFASKADVDTVKALQAEFAAELATLRGRVDGLESRVATVEAQQFSTTTKLQGEVVIAGQFGDFVDNPADTFVPAIPPIPPVDLDGDGTLDTAPIAGLGPFPGGGSRASVLARVRLNFNTSFSGEDLLQTQLEVGNNGQDFLTAAGFESGLNPLPVGLPLGSTSLVDLGAVDYTSISNNVTLRRLAYSFKPFGQDFTATVGSNIFPSDFIDFNSYANNSAQDFSSGFFINNPLIVTNPVDFNGGAGAAFDWNPNGGPFSLRALYIAANAQNAAGNAGAGEGNVVCNVLCTGGLGNDPHQASVELELANTFGADDNNNYAVRLQGTFAETFGVRQTVAGINAEVTFGKIGIFGRYGASFDPQFLGNDIFGSAGLIPGPDTLVQSWMGGVGVRDFIVPGSLLAAAGGMPFLVTNDGLPNQTNLELFYRLPVSDNITVTPTVMYIINPGNTSNALIGDENDIIQGLVRATFSF